MKRINSLPTLPIAVAAASLALASSASAGQYVHVSCDSSARGTDGWQSVLSAGQSVPRTTTGDSCASGGSLRADLIPEETAGIYAGSGAAWQYNAPGGTSIARVRMRVRGWIGTYMGAVTQVRASAGTSLLRLWDNDGFFDETFDQRVNVPAGQVTMALLCATTCQTHWPLGSMDLSNARVTLDDDSAPTGTAETGLSSGTPLSGSVPLVVYAKDRGAGVREARLRVGSSFVWRQAATGGTCTPIAAEGDLPVFSTAAPCPGSEAIAGVFDTLSLADGSHAASLEVVDAAGNIAQVAAFSMLIVNRPPSNVVPPSILPAGAAASPSVGSSLAADPGSWIGPSLEMSYRWQRCSADGDQCADITGAASTAYTPVAADAGRRLRFAATAKNVTSVTRYSAITGIVTGGVAATSSGRNGTLDGPDCRDDAVVLRALGLRSGVLSVRRSTRRRAQVRVELVCAEDGRPVRAASLRVTMRRAGADEPVGTLVETDRDGIAILRLPSTASRTITMTYRLRDDDPVARASTVVRLAVRNTMTFRVRQQGEIARFRGRVAGGHVPARGVSIQLQWKDGSRWRPVANLRTDSRGRFRYTYRFSSRGRGFRYAFRAVVTPGQVDYPFVPARSGVHRAGPR